ncbi:hypothetical protein CERSUDRAFT_117887 [Gelatoporia subvermispora B]|uniref:Uncharacterized protein n=1 Tax=Ceriporiopsis subvermispora (strain B) TaxID=914234 RepID=M2R6J0_CERS8|nr:hypothetical protein CERSUDRAFT_117887 [Gelatoporia subvermispora B]
MTPAEPRRIFATAGVSDPCAQPHISPSRPGSAAPSGRLLPRRLAVERCIQSSPTHPPTCRAWRPRFRICTRDLGRDSRLGQRRLGRLRVSLFDGLRTRGECAELCGGSYCPLGGRFWWKIEQGLVAAPNLLRTSSCLPLSLSRQWVLVEAHAPYSTSAPESAPCTADVETTSSLRYLPYHPPAQASHDLWVSSAAKSDPPLFFIRSIHSGHSRPTPASVSCSIDHIQSSTHSRAHHTSARVRTNAPWRFRIIFLPSREDSRFYSGCGTPSVVRPHR